MLKSTLAPLPERCQECQKPECFCRPEIADEIETFNESPITKLPGSSLLEFLNYRNLLTDNFGVPICQSRSLAQA
ncbi:MAG: hypothetical protein HY764_04315 [Candidatus Portnoybacteria bacterium]|nr:hypothetical protein [Candidatus Portnoybacteria bacterium]